MSLCELPIGIFDSGVGGLTVYRALQQLLPHENYVYLGDTARVPYGSKSPELVTQFSLQITARLLQEQIKLLVVACNTATAQALPVLQRDNPDLPIIGVINPGAAAAVEATRNGKILVLATAGTVKTAAYSKAITALKTDMDVMELACGILVTMVEEGWSEVPETLAVIARYLRAAHDFDYDTVVLGCTHFPLLRPAVQNLLPPHIRIVDSASTTAQQVKDYLLKHELANPALLHGDTQFLVTDAGQNFNSVAQKFLQSDSKIVVETVDIDGLQPYLAAA